MVDIQPNIEKKIPQGEAEFSKAFEAEKDLAVETPQTDIRENQVTPESIREQLAKPDGIVTEEFREKVMEPIARGEAPVTASPKDELNKLITHGLPPFEEMEGVMVAIDEHRKNSDPSLN